jgi:hypothetical protein
VKDYTIELHGRDADQFIAESDFADKVIAAIIVNQVIPALADRYYVSDHTYIYRALERIITKPRAPVSSDAM